MMNKELWKLIVQLKSDEISLLDIKNEVSQEVYNDLKRVLKKEYTVIEKRRQPTWGVQISLEEII
jgi:hypothetical protein